MSGDIKSIAKAMVEEFAQSVNAAEANDAAEIKSVRLTMEDAFKIYVQKVDEATAKKDEAMKMLEEAYEKEDEAKDFYAKEILEFSKRLDTFERIKLQGFGQVVVTRADGAGGQTT